MGWRQGSSSGWHGLAPLRAVARGSSTNESGLTEASAELNVLFLEAIGPLQNSFSDYVKNASLTYI